MNRRAQSALVVTAGLLLGFILPAAPARADEPRDAEWQLGFLNMTAAWQVTRGNGVTVGVIDSGINGGHPDLAGNVLRGTSLVPGHPGDGWEDVDYHGTNMAGLIAGHGHNGTDGVLGIAPQAKILPIQIGTADVVGGADLLAAGVNYAVGHGAKVISISLSIRDASGGLQAAIDRAAESDVVVVAGVGNAPIDTTVGLPARYPGVVAVGAVDRSGNHADVSVVGPQVLVSAPGVDVETTGPQNEYGRATGTSVSTAITSGVVALIRAKYPLMSAASVIRRLTETADDKGAPGRDSEYGYGIVNPYAALTANVPPSSSAGPGEGGTGKSAGPSSPGSTSPSPQATGSKGNNKAGLAVVAVLVVLAVGATIWIRRAASRYRKANY